MKTFVRNIIIILFYLTSIPLWRRLFLRKPLLRVWCLHEVKDYQINQFERKIKYLASKYNIITPEQFIKQDYSSEKLNILITFDDGFESWFTNVLPILQRHNLKAIFFINKDFQNLKSKRSDVNFFNNEKFLKYAEQLVGNGHALGGHSFSHQRLTALDHETMSKEIFLSVKSDFFAYPYGDKKSFNQLIISELKKAGYKYGFTILPGFNKKTTNYYLSRRDALDADVPDLIFKLWFKGCYDWLKILIF